MKAHGILADPPWPERGGGKIKRGADRHYELMSVEDITKQMVAWSDELVADDAHIYLWVTNNYLEDGLAVMRACGFRYITNLPWVKDRKGLGQYFRGEHELLLFGVRGKLKTLRNDIGTVIRAPRGKHSRKPRKVYWIVRQQTPPPHIEVFSRDNHEDFEVIGNEAPPEKQKLLKIT